MGKGLERMENFVKKNRFIIAAYLFGSAAEGKARKLSDIDLGFYLKKMGKREMFEKELLLVNKATDFFRREDIDVVIMNYARTSLNFNIIKGKLIASNDEEKRVKFETRIMRDYLDNDYHEKLRAKIGIERIALQGLS